MSRRLESTRAARLMNAGRATESAMIRSTRHLPRNARRRASSYAASARSAASASAEPAAEPSPAGPEAGGPCTDDMIAVEVRTAEAAVAVGSKPTLDLVVTNTSAVPCVRALDKALQEIVLLDAGGDRVWGSNDCFPEASSDLRTLAPGEAVGLRVIEGRRGRMAVEVTAWDAQAKRARL